MTENGWLRHLHLVGTKISRVNLQDKKSTGVERNYQMTFKRFISAGKEANKNDELESTHLSPTVATFIVQNLDRF